MGVEVIKRTVNLAEFEKLQADVVVLEKDVSDKQKVIDKLQTDLTAQQGELTTLAERVE